MKIKIFTHTDLDGLCSELVVREFYKNSHAEISVERCNYNNINGALYGFLKSGEVNNYNLAYITDISCSEKMAEWIDSSYKDKFVLLDHHSTATWLNKYGWCTVKEDNGTEKIAGADVVAEHLGMVGKNTVLDQIIHINKKYDTWAWKSEGYVLANELNKIAYMIGFEKLMDEFQSQINLADKDLDIEGFKFKSEWEFLLEIDNMKYQKYLETANKVLQIREYKGSPFGYVFAENYISELGNDLAVLNPNLDFIAIINLKTGVSLRGIKEGIHLGEVAKEMGDALGCNGGGHAMASGISVTNDFKDRFVDSIFFPNKHNDIPQEELGYWEAN